MSAVPKGHEAVSSGRRGSEIKGWRKGYAISGLIWPIKKSHDRLVRTEWRIHRWYSLMSTPAEPTAVSFPSSVASVVSPRTRCCSNGSHSERVAPSSIYRRYLVLPTRLHLRQPDYSRFFSSPSLSLSSFITGQGTRSSSLARATAPSFAVKLRFFRFAERSAYFLYFSLFDDEFVHFRIPLVRISLTPSGFPLRGAQSRRLAILRCSPIYRPVR